jgi:hypothetical protein
MGFSSLQAARIWGTVTWVAMSRWTDRLIRGACALLVLVGLASAALRAIAMEDLFARVEPARVGLMTGLGVSEPAPERRAEVVARSDRKFATHRATTLIHILTGAGFLALVPLQLLRRVRARAPAVHRVAGRVAIILAWASGLTGLFFGLRQPLAGLAEQVVVGAVGLLLLGATGIAFHHVRAGRTGQHREWMLRAIAAALVISSVRIVALPLDLLLAPRGVGPRVIFGLALWLGCGVTLVFTEWWIRRTRPVKLVIFGASEAQPSVRRTA